MIFNVNFKTLSSLIKSACVGVWTLYTYFNLWTWSRTQPTESPYCAKTLLSLYDCGQAGWLTLQSGRNDLGLWLVESYISKRGVPVYPTDVSHVDICRNWTPVLDSEKHSTHRSEIGMAIIAFCSPINHSIMILRRMVEWLISDMGGRCKICPCPGRENVLGEWLYSSTRS